MASSAAAGELISVVVPLHNGAGTLPRTLASIRNQSWGAFEAVVVDDGSTDDGPQIAQEMADLDPRFRLVRQANGGVARARNRGAAETRGSYLAFVDADDLWSPDKLRLQFEALQAEGPACGLAYSWSALIDEQDRVYSTSWRPEFEGEVFHQLARSNFVGNGSCVLMRREAFEAVGGYESSLRDRGAQGCEDLMIYMKIAERFGFRVVRRHLTGYRVTRGNMSSRALAMLRSCELTLDAFRERYPELAPEFDAHVRNMAYWLVVRALTTGPLHNAAAVLARQGFRHAFDLAPRAGDLAWMFLKAHAPASLKKAGVRLLSPERRFRPDFLELA